MLHSVRFISSLIIILLLSWINIYYLGTSEVKLFSPLMTQFLHCVVMGLTGLTGYFYWKNGEKWINILWTGLYLIVFFIIGVVALIYVFKGSMLDLSWNAVISEIRNAFTGPLPFLVFALLVKVINNTKKMDIPAKS